MKTFKSTPTTLLALCLSCVFTFALSAQAASFDCGKASTKVEHIICDNAEISKLDDELDAAYKAALKDVEQTDAIKQAQKVWMKERNGCEDVDCVKRRYESEIAFLKNVSALAARGAKDVLYLTGHEEFASESEKLKFMQNIVMKHKFHSPEYPANSEFCQQLLKDFSTGKDLIRAVEPDVRANDENDPRLAKWHQCENPDVDKPTRIDGFDFFSDLGGAPYRYYRIDLDGNPRNGKEDIIYTEMHQPGTKWAGTGQSGYHWIDLHNCVHKGGVRVYAQYPPEPLHLGMYHLSTIVKYRGRYLTMELNPIGGAYHLVTGAFDSASNHKGYYCAWWHEPRESGNE